MNITTQNNREITDREEILEILEAALIHAWNFSYATMVKNHLTSQTAKLLEVKSQATKITVDIAALKASHSPIDTLVFRAQNGGMSVIFKSKFLQWGNNGFSTQHASECQFEFPELVRFSQLRNAIRINLTNLHDIPVTFFAKKGVRLQGKVVDISATGAKIKFEGDFSTHVDDSRLIADCQMLLPNESRIEAQAQVLGVVYDKEQDISYVRCQYVEMKPDDQLQLKRLISTTIKQTGLAIIS
ncbi:MAG: PilZ domain-containing protein [Proteobacteria bacterium]|nr:PilZ domain-containing protein [Pseudomonadota bacterium]